jgi:Tol biopolymer transport system component/predicted Ser/Thr protein kinase
MVGRTLLHYRILEKLGEGGMGVVYKAQDLKLNRLVAVKFLPHDIADRADEQERLLLEARSASALNHPNVCVIHAIEEHEGRPFIVMEYVEGVTLEERLRAAPLKLDEVVSYAVQMGSALEAAHQRGVVHRDIKTENVMVGSHGQIKVMDFGLAKLRDSIRRTRSATTSGTLSYLAPEQILGQGTDARCDIFSFGVVIYEMLTGQLPFRGEHEAAILYAIVNQDPEPVAKYRAGLSSECLHVLNRALEKDREDRYQSVSDMLIDLRRVRREVEGERSGPLAPVEAAVGAAPAAAVTPGEVGLPPAAPPASPAPSAPAARPAAAPLPVPARLPRRSRWRAAGLVALGLLATGVAAVLTRGRFVGRPAPPVHREVTFTGKAYFPAISPDGQTIAYLLTEPGREPRVMVQDLAGGQPLEVFHLWACRGLRWSPDGAEIHVFSNFGVTNLVPRMGGAPRRLGWGRIQALSPDGKVQASSDEPLKAIFFRSVGGSDTSSIPLPGGFTFLEDLDWSPSGQMLLYLAYDPARWSIWTIRRDGRQARKVHEDTLALNGPRWAPKGDAIYCLRSGGGTSEVIKIRLTSDGGPSHRPPRTLLSGLQLGPQLGLSRDGKRLVCTRATDYSNLWLVSPRGTTWGGGVQSRRLTNGTSRLWGARLSPDGRRVAYVAGYGDVEDIQTLSLADSSRTRLTYLQAQIVGGLAWSPDGREIAFGARRGGSALVWTVPSAGGPPRAFAKTALSTMATGAIEWAPGKEILYERPGNRNFSRLDPTTEVERPLVANDSVGWMFEPRVSPDGRHVALFWNRLPRSGLWVVSLTDSTQRTLLAGGGSPSAWTPAGDAVYMAWRVIYRVSLAHGDTTRVVRLPFEVFGGVEMTPDARTVICTVPESQSDVWVVDDFDPEVR